MRRPLLSLRLMFSHAPSCSGDILAKTDLGVRRE